MTLHGVSDVLMAGRAAVRFSKRVGLFNFGAAHSTFYDFVEKPKKVGKVDPESAIEATRVQPTIHQCVMVINHHETFAFQAVH